MYILWEVDEYRRDTCLLLWWAVSRQPQINNQLAAVRLCLKFPKADSWILLYPQDKRLRSGDQILRIGDTDLAGMNSEQVAQVSKKKCKSAALPTDCKKSFTLHEFHRPVACIFSTLQHKPVLGKDCDFGCIRNY